MPISLDALVVVDAIARGGSFAAAARALHRVPSAVSYAVRQLELEVGVTVFARTARGPRLTPAGEALLAFGRDALRAADAAVDAARQAARGPAGLAVRVSAVEAAARHPLARRVLDAYRRRRPDVRVSLVELDTRAQRAALAEGLVDVAVGFALGDVAVAAPGHLAIGGTAARAAAERAGGARAADHAPRLRGAAPAPRVAIAEARLADDPLDSALLAADHPLAARRELRLADLAGEPLVLFPYASNPALHDAVHAAFAHAEYAAEAAHEACGSAVTWALVAQGAGWAPKPHSYRRHPPPGTVARHLADFRVPCALCLAWRRDDAPAHVLEFVDAVRATRGRRARPAGAPSAPRAA
jgi:DNA-binding transcriptional LysR family regulator